MSEPEIPEAVEGQVITSEWGNKVRIKIQDPALGHKHDGVGSRSLDGYASPRIEQGADH